ncbi:MAG: MoaD/ThiS family protein [Candidatus Latescibacteria bacterium]|nr:MoaD/ThiS family protein [Candidatus Latescibacterota bacterium]
MSIRVRIPTPLRRLTQNQSDVEARGSTIQDLIDDLDSQYSGMKERLLDESGEVRRFVNIYVNEEDIRFLEGKQTPLKEGDSISIIPAIAGGCCLL